MGLAFVGRRHGAASWPRSWSCGPPMAMKPGYAVKPEPNRECQRAVPDADMQ